MDQAELDSLAASIREHGVLQPILVTETLDGYQLVAGERRVPRQPAWPASSGSRRSSASSPIASSSSSPSSRTSSARISEPIEEAHAYRRCIDEFALDPRGDRPARRPREVDDREHAPAARPRSEPSRTPRRRRDLPRATPARSAASPIEHAGARRRQRRRPGALGSPDRGARPSPARAPRRDRAGRAPSAPSTRTSSASRRTCAGRSGRRSRLARSRKGGRIIIEFYSDEELGQLYDRLIGGTCVTERSHPHAASRRDGTARPATAVASGGGRLGLQRGEHPGPRGPRGGSRRPGMYIGSTDETRPPPPRVGGRRQLDRRGDGRPRDEDHGHDQGRRDRDRGTTTAAACRSASTRPARTPSRSSTPCSTPAASSAAAATRCPAVSTASASASSTRCPSGCGSNPPATAASGPRNTRAASRLGPVKKIGPQGDRRGTTTAFRADPEMFETTEYSFETIGQRLRESAYLTKGVWITLVDERIDRERSFYFEGGLAVVRPPPEPEQGGPPQPPDLRRAARGHDRGRGRPPVQRHVHRERPLVRQQHQHGRRRDPRHRLPGGPDELAQRLGAPGGRAQGQRPQPVRRRRPRGPHRRRSASS